MIYLDNAASAPVLDCALSAAEPFLRDCWGNPSSIHTEGRRAALALIEAREKCARAIGAAPADQPQSLRCQEAASGCKTGNRKHAGRCQHRYSSGIILNNF